MSTNNTPLDTELTISVYLKRDNHENGMTIQEYADAVIAGTAPILDHDEYVYQFGAVKDELELVESWATDNNLTIIESVLDAALIKLSGTVEQFNNIFSITLKTVEEDNRTYITHDTEISLPHEINSVIDIVLGLDNSIKFSHNATIDTSEPGPFSPNLVSNPTPVDLALAYKFPRAPGSDIVQGDGQCVAIIELGGGYTTQNLTSTFSRINQPNPVTVDISVDGGINDPATYDPSGANGEVMLDIYCVAAVAPATKIAMYFAPNSYQGFIDTIVFPTNDIVNNPSVISVSWGTTDTNWSAQNRTAFENALAAAVVKGITVFVAAGDFGVRAVSGGSTYTVQYPATSPYVVCAGGTVISINNDYSIAYEVPWGFGGGSFAGGGGVSGIYSVPSWQTGFSSKTYPGGTVSLLTGRGIPDVSAMATGYTFYWYNYTSLTPVDNQAGTFLGTSATAPLLAGMMARLNQLTGRRIGFVNSDWYSIRATAFNDLTTGDNHGGNTSGYMATAGWDACTGLGSPIGTEIYKFYKSGTTFPRLNKGFRPTVGQAYPRPQTGVR